MKQMPQGNNLNRKRDYGYSVVWELFKDRRACMSGERSTWVYTVDDEDIRLSGLVQVNDVYAEVPLWCASEPIARRWIVPKCIWKLSDCKNGSECYEIATRGRVRRIL
jgi:hypothetical protein